MLPNGGRLVIGSTLGHYRILEQIGAGGMGVVYRARDEHLDRDVAIKVLPSGTLTDESARKRFHKEALTLSKLNHPNIGTVFDFDTQDGVDFLVMEYVQGVTLDRKAAAGGLAEREVAALGEQIAAALQEAHERGVVHRDLKPSNIAVTPKGQVKVLDFGLATLLHPGSAHDATLSATEAGQTGGTLPYMAPEQLRDEKVDARTDIHALGAVLYEMTTGQRPFREAIPLWLTDAILHQPPVPPRAVNSRVAPELERIVLKCLEKDPENRYQSVKEVAVDLRRLGAPPSSTKVLAAPRARTRAWLLGAGALILIALLAAIGFRRLSSVTPGPPTTAAAKPSVAVLPLQNMSADPGNDYFSDGMTEEIISKLSRIKGLEVTSRTSVARYKGTQKDIKEIGRELGVRYLLEGSVRKAGDRVRITAQLIDSTNGFHVWAQDFDRELKDVFAVQEETALEIAEALNLSLTPQEQQAVRRRYTENPQAHDAYLRGSALVQDLEDPVKLEAARHHFEQALQQDPEYAPALAGLSLVEATYYRNVAADEARLLNAEGFARRALAVDSKLPVALLAYGLIRGHRYDYAGAVAQFREAVRLEPDSDENWRSLAWALTYVQPPEPVEAEKCAREAIRIQPSQPASHYQLGRALTLQKRYPDALAAFRYALELNASYRAPHLGFGQIYLAQGKYDLALAELRLAERTGISPVVVVQRASVYAAKGDKEKALSELTRALAADYHDFAYLDSSPYLASLRSDPRYQELIKRYRK